MDPAYANIAFSDRDRAAATLSSIVQSLPPTLRTSLPALLAQLPAPDEALNFLERFLRPEGKTQSRTVSYLERYPTALHYLLTAFSYSRFLSETLVQQPDLITTLHRPPRPSDAGAPTRSTRGIEHSRSP